MENVNSISVTIPNPTPAQIEALTNILAGNAKKKAPMGEMAAASKRGGNKTPLKTTVSAEEDEDFGTEALDEEDLDTDEVEEEEEEPAIKFSDLRKQINKLGNEDPKAMKTILASFNIKKAAEVEQHPKKYEAIFRKIKAKLKILGVK